MARRVQVILEDDIDGGIADETVTFALDGVRYEIDLTTANADSLRKAMSPYVAHGRRLVGPGSRSRRAAGSSRAAEIRAWAQANGVKVSERGRVPADVVSKYEAATG